MGVESHCLWVFGVEVFHPHTQETAETKVENIGGMTVMNAPLLSIKGILIFVLCFSGCSAMWEAMAFASYRPILLIGILLVQGYGEKCGFNVF